MKELGLNGRRPDGLPQSIRYLSRDEPSQIFYGYISTLCKSQGACHDLKKLLEPVHKRPIFTNTAQNFKNLRGSVAARLEVGPPAGFLEPASWKGGEPSICPIAGLKLLEFLPDK